MMVGYHYSTRIRPTEDLLGIYLGDKRETKHNSPVNFVILIWKERNILFIASVLTAWIHNVYSVYPKVCKFWIYTPD